MPKYTLDVKLFSQVEVEAISLQAAVAAVNAGIGKGEVRLGAWEDGRAIAGSAELDDEDPDVVDVRGAGVAECQDCGGRWGENDLHAVRHLTERVLPGEPMPAGECPDCGAVCHLIDSADGTGTDAAGDAADGGEAPEVAASVHSDDRLYEAHFNAGMWLSRASDGEIRALHEIGFRGDYAADAVAEYFERTNPEIAAVFEYCRRSQAGGREGVGFECVVDEEKAMEWLKAHRPNLHADLALEGVH